MVTQDIAVPASELLGEPELSVTAIRPPPDGLMVLKTSRGLRFEAPADIEWLEADRNNVIFHIRGEPITVRVKMSELETTLDANRFVRISRSSMVNLAHVREAASLEGGLYMFEMRSGRRLRSSRGRARLIRKLAASVRLW